MDQLKTDTTPANGSWIEIMRKLQDQYAELKILESVSPEESKSVSLNRIRLLLNKTDKEMEEIIRAL